jgi:outer membrane immunogenic protein
MKTIYALLNSGLASALAVIASSPAFAQQADTTGGGQTPAQAFSGATVEATFGWDHLAQKSIKDIDSSAYTKGSGDGVTYGGAVGYDVPLTSNVTVGAEVGLYGSSAKWNNTENLVGGTFNTERVKPGRDLFVGARLGYALSPKTQIFGKAGYTNTHFAIEGTNGADTQYQGLNASGFRLGTGVEQKLTKMTYVKLEYDYSHYGSGQFNYYGNTPDGSNFDLRTSRSQVLASVGVRF